MTPAVWLFIALLRAGGSSVCPDFRIFMAQTTLHMRKIFLSTALFLSIAASASAQDPAETKIRQLMQTQIEAWNKGDIEGFMATYWKSDSLLFIGKKD